MYFPSGLVAPQGACLRPYCAEIPSDRCGRNTRRWASRPPPAPVPPQPRARLTFEGDRDVIDPSAAGRHLGGLGVQHPLHVADAVALDGLGAEPQGGGWVHLGNIVLTTEGDGGGGEAPRGDDTHGHARETATSGGTRETEREGRACPQEGAKLPGPPGPQHEHPLYLEHLKDGLVQHLPVDLPADLAAPQEEFLLLQVLRGQRRSPWASGR